MSQKCDLHLHTTFSDGINTLEEICEYTQKENLKFVSITDHNTVSGIIELERKRQKPAILLYGTELRLPGLPDLLIYFPQMALPEAQLLEKDLRELGELDQEVTLAVASDFINSDNADLISLWKQSCFFNTTGNYWLGTLQLGQLISDDLHPSIEVISSIRSQKSIIFRNLGTLTAADLLVEKATIDWVLMIAKKYRGNVVLAHPFKEIARHYHEHKKMDFNFFSEKLTSLFTQMEQWGIVATELISMYSSRWWDDKFSFSLEDANNLLFSLCVRNKIKLTVGSDSHNFAYSEDLLFSEVLDGKICEFTPEWIK